MKFTPEVAFNGGCLQPLSSADVDAVAAVLNACDLPKSESDTQKTPEHVQRMMDLSHQMAATQRGMMWLLKVGDVPCALVNAYDWNPSQLRVTLRIDATAALGDTHFVAALDAVVALFAQRYHVRNVAYQCVAQHDARHASLEAAGFYRAAQLKDAWRTGQWSFCDIQQYHRIVEAPDAMES